MKRIDIQTNVERARHMYELMPDEMPSFLEFINAKSKKVIQDAEHLRAYWEHPLLSANQWIRLATVIQTQLECYDGKLKSAKKFSEELFGGYRGIFSAVCVQEYAHNNDYRRFKALATLFFGYNPADWKG